MIENESSLGVIADISAELEHAQPQEIVDWAVASFGADLALACSFGGPSGMVLLDMIVKTDVPVPIYYLDTGLLFEETYKHIMRVSEHYGIVPIAVATNVSLREQAATHGDELWKSNPDLCCNIRKVLPQREFLAKYAAWISGIRRDQSSNRLAVPIIAWDKKFDLVKINPLANWTEEMLWTYIEAHGVPYNPLHDDGYPSIGCFPCTAHVAPGEDARAGRWQGFAKTECGLHG